jgi:hypothetical protein
MKHVLAATAFACLLAGCQTASNPSAWGQIATGVGALVGETKIDPQIERISTKFAAYCADSLGVGRCTYRAAAHGGPRPRYGAANFRPDRLQAV